ncbi:hypothetical protein LWP59_10035 [Amycolatopsis acidiphila]|uniref:ESX-1 secretion-associated protein n=1 Tax=Amycolatopsis acidiphila TaxID=715473 RepID=A0A558A1I0_9PSEU|nr:hypothetical protein [Amycolatopsis acidiphila]TVT18121.1 hypothetical protein FNH06_28900 [Amycolatopsis acidiphila]UIJ61930.1 hypothetical protein LWP59_10035 [Amycolatopsis acidiphila]GHG57092.1 hypothetical protein GCM10017788_08430 [Amycolatopsis acidiphila]
MAGEGFSVDPAELRTFGGYLTNTTAAAVKEAASGVHAANGFDNQAFGVLVAQILAVPARIAMATVADNLDKVSQDVTTAADTTTKAAAAYADHDDSVSAGLGEFTTELGR